MFPTKISLVAAGLVLILTAVAHQAATSSLTRAAKQETTDQVDRAAGLFLSQNRLQALEFTNETAEFARQEGLAKIFTLTDEAERRRTAKDAAEALNEQKIAKAHDGQRAALVAVVDAAGKVVARDLNINALYGEDLKARYQSVAKALVEGKANKDVWAFQNRMYQVSCAPIRGADGRVAGALIVGFEESAKDARRLKDAFGTNVVVFLDGKIYASSFAQQGQNSQEEQELAQALFNGPKHAEPAMRDRKRTAVFEVALRGETYLAAAAPMLGNTSHPQAGFVVLSSLEAANKGARGVGLWVLGLGVVAAIMTLIAAVYTSRRFLAAIDEIEQGVTEIINGNHDYVFEKQGNIDFEGLENALNVMVARLLGRPEPAEGGVPMPQNMDLVSGGMAISSSRPPEMAGPGTPKLSPENLALAQEPEEQYQRRLYDEYAHAREQTGEGTRDLSFASFIEKLKDNEIALCKKYSARMVRFKVIIKQGQVTLKPVPIP